MCNRAYVWRHSVEKVGHVMAIYEEKRVGAPGHERRGGVDKFAPASSSKSSACCPVIERFAIDGLSAEIAGRLGLG
jgi:hypothetical protein